MRRLVTIVTSAYSSYSSCRQYREDLAGAVAQVDDESRGSLERNVVAKWQDFVRDRALVLQVRIIVASARK